jgi:hypothetical protein
MHRMVRATLLVAVIGFTAATTLVSSRAADLNAIKTAADQLVTLGKDAYKTGQAPSATDPKVAALLSTITDTRDLALSPPLPIDKIGTFVQRENALERVRRMYELAGTGYTKYSETAKAADSNKVMAQIDHNIVTYAGELGQLYDAELVVVGATIECFGSELWAHPEEFEDPESRTDIITIRANTVKVVTNLFKKLIVPGLTDDWRRQRVVALVAMAPYVAKFLLPEQRKLLHDRALNIAHEMADPILQAGLKGVADLFIS